MSGIDWLRKAESFCKMYGWDRNWRASRKAAANMELAAVLRATYEDGRLAGALAVAKNDAGPAPAVQGPAP